MFDTVRNNSPDALELKCLEVSGWAIEYNKSANRLCRLQFLIDAGVADIVHAIRVSSAHGIFYRFIFDSL